MEDLPQFDEPDEYLPEFERLEQLIAQLQMLNEKIFAAMLQVPLEQWPAFQAATDTYYGEHPQRPRGDLDTQVDQRWHYYIWLGEQNYTKIPSEYLIEFYIWQCDHGRMPKNQG